VGVVPVVQHAGQQVPVSRGWRGEQVPGIQHTAVANPWRASTGRARPSTWGWSTRTPWAAGAARSTAASRVPVPPAMSAIVPEGGQSRTGTQASDSAPARWTIAWSNSAC